MNDASELPLGQYAIIELFGHQTLVGRIEEVERFGTKMLSVEILFRNELLPAALHGGAAIYRLTPCSADIARSKQHTEEWHLPTAIRSTLPPTALPPPDASSEDYEYDEEEIEP